MFRNRTARCLRLKTVAAVSMLLALAACNETAPEEASTPEPVQDQEQLEQSVLTVEGLGAVRLGMTLHDMEQAAGAAFARRDPAGYESESCWYTDRLEHPLPHVAFMMDQDRLVRIDVMQTDEADNVPLRTASGFGVGSSEDAILARYGAAVQKTPHPYLGAAGSVLRIQAPHESGVLLFETADGKVTRFRTGFAPAVDFKEGCS